MGKKERHLPIEIDPERAPVVREAFDLLLSGNYTLQAVCQELHARGHVRRSGLPWVYPDKDTGQTKYATSPLSNIIKNPFYAGWLTSQKYRIRPGEIRGNWEPLITEEEFERGLAILAEHDVGKIRRRKYVYLLAGLLHMQAGRLYRMSGSTPTGRSKSYQYYMTLGKPGGQQRHILCEEIDAQLPALMHALQVDPALLPEVRRLYRDQVDKLRGPSTAQRMEEMQAQVNRMRNEEGALARLYAQGRLSDDMYDQLYQEWRGKLLRAEQEIARLKADNEEIMGDLDAALELLQHAPRLFERLEPAQQARVLQILFARIIIDTQGQIIETALNPPFTYLHRVVQEVAGAANGGKKLGGSSGIQSTLLT